mmetsp:Transcript_39127/g.61569  ORF Transcript_39127/g.61569 Transcript_39127/m.61569 type:complete len:482 (+) Transcript_39127:648-2093(+)
MVWQQGPHDRMAGLVVGDQLLRGVVLQGPSLQAGDHAVRRIVDLVHCNGLLVPARRQNGALVHQVLQVRAAEAGGALGDVREGDALRQLLVLHVHLQDLFPSLDVRQPHGHAAIEAPRPQQGVVQDVGTIGGGHHDDSAVPFEAVHLCQDLIQGLLALIVATAHAGAALPADGVDLIDEDDAGRLLLGLLEDITDPGGTNAHKQLNKLGGRRLDKRHTGLAGQGLGHQGLSRTWWSGQENAPRDLGAHLDEAFRGLQEVHDLHELFLGLVDARHVFELHACLWLNHNLSLALIAEARDSAAATATGAKEQQAPDDQQREGDVTQDAKEGVRLVGLVHLNGDVLRRQLLDEAGGGSWQVADQLLFPSGHVHQGHGGLAEVVEVHALHRALVHEFQEPGVGDASADAGRCPRLLHLRRPKGLHLRRRQILRRCRQRRGGGAEGHQGGRRHGLHDGTWDRHVLSHLLHLLHHLLPSGLRFHISG